MITWLRPRQRVPAARSGAGRAERPAGRGRRSFARPHPRRVSARHLPVVRRRPADPVVESRSADGAVRRRVPRVALAAQARAARATSRSASTPRSSDVMRAVRAMRRGAASAARGSRRRSSTPTASCTAAGFAHSVEAWRDGELVGRTLRPRARPHVLRRVDVRARDRRVEGRAGRTWSRCCERLACR